MFPQNYSTRTFLLTAPLYISIKSLRKTLNLEKLKLGGSYKKLIYTDNHEENICNKLQKLSKIGQKQKTLTFVYG